MDTVYATNLELGSERLSMVHQHLIHCLGICVHRAKVAGTVSLQNDLWHMSYWTLFTFMKNGFRRNWQHSNWQSVCNFTMNRNCLKALSTFVLLNYKYKSSAKKTCMERKSIINVITYTCFIGNLTIGCSFLGFFLPEDLRAQTQRRVAAELWTYCTKLLYYSSSSGSVLHSASNWTAWFSIFDDQVGTRSRWCGLLCRHVHELMQRNKNMPFKKTSEIIHW